MNQSTLHYAFLDESGTAGLSKGTNFLVVAVLSTETPRELELMARRALKKAGRNPARGELKATQSSEKDLLHLLESVAGHEVSIVAVIVDQQSLTQEPEDAEEIYRLAVSRAVRRMAEHFPRLDVCLDKRYTHEPLRYALEARIREELMELAPQMILLHHQGSHTRKELQIVDAVAWAFFQKYERGNERYCNLLAPKILAEEVISLSG
jgi:hypothetical protein